VKLQIGEPGGIRRLFPTSQHIPECPEIAPHVVEYAVQNQAHAPAVHFLRKGRQRLVIPQAAVQPKIIGGVIAMRGRFK
jgi:hypothetical protein